MEHSKACEWWQWPSSDNVLWFHVIQPILDNVLGQSVEASPKLTNVFDKIIRVHGTFSYLFEHFSISVIFRRIGLKPALLHNIAILTYFEWRSCGAQSMYSLAVVHCVWSGCLRDLRQDVWRVARGDHAVTICHLCGTCVQQTCLMSTAATEAKSDEKWTPPGAIHSLVAWCVADTTTIKTHYRYLQLCKATQCNTELHSLHRNLHEFSFA